MSIDTNREKKIQLMSPEGDFKVRYMVAGEKRRDAIEKELMRKPHLDQCKILMEQNCSDRVIVICDTIRQGLDACHTLVDLLALIHQEVDGSMEETKEPKETDELDQFFRDLDIELEEEELHGSDSEGEPCDGENPLEELCTNKNQYVIYSEKEIDQGACNDLGETPEKAMMFPPKKSGIPPQAAAAMILLCDGLTALSEETMELLLEQKEKPMILLIPKRKINHQKIDRLLFEGGFELVETASPSLEYMVDQFRDALEQEGLFIDESLDVKSAIRSLKQERGEKFGERDMILLAKAVQKSHLQRKQNGNQISEIAIPHYTMGKSSGKKLLDQIVGLEEVKEILETEINRHAYRNRMMELLHQSGKEGEEYTPCRNMAFCGNPGTCKTTMARAMALRMGELGITNGSFFEVGREQLVGRYLGETSMKVAKIFEKARGGVLFIDEAGSLASEGGDHFAEEAVSAIVRHMENDRETVVILASYNGDMERLMNTNEGLRSRIGRMVQFPDYTPEQLAEIFRSMASARGYELEAGVDYVATKYFKKASQRDDFGAGREARRLLDQAEGQLANWTIGGKYTQEKLFLLTNEAIEDAAKRLLGETKETRRTMGFAPRVTT